MKKIEFSLKSSEKILHDTHNVLAKLRKHTIRDPETVRDAIKVLENIRHDVYEDLNQIQHEYLIIRAAMWLQKNQKIPQDATWSWNPRQTGTADQPDLACDLNGSRIISAEITTSKKPQGVIDKRMKGTLDKLDEMRGKKFYFVQTESMFKRATSKVTNNNLDITVVLLQGDVE
jgi:hypothetical protein